MAKSKIDDLQETKRLMGALVRMKSKPHEEMKVGKKRAKKSKPKKKPGKLSRASGGTNVRTDRFWWSRPSQTRRD
jgi:hypothetical protein